MTKTLNDKTIELDTINEYQRKGYKVIVGDLVRAIRVNKPDGTKGFFYRKSGTYQMEHAGEKNVGEYENVKTIFPEYTSELQAERTDLISMIGASVDDEIDTLEEAYNV